MNNFVLSSNYVKSITSVLDMLVADLDKMYRNKKAYHWGTEIEIRSIHIDHEGDLMAFIQYSAGSMRIEEIPLDFLTEVPNGE